MLKLFKVERRVEDYLDKFDIDHFVVGAEDDNKAIEAVKSRYRDKNNDSVSYRSRKVLDISTSQPIEVGTAFVCYIVNTVKDNNKE